MSLRQRLASDLASGNLTHSPLIETGADRIGALGLSDRLGAAMWRILAEHDVGATREAIAILSKLLTRGRLGRKRSSTLVKLCWVCVQERLADKCRRCHGRGFLIAEGDVRHACTACEGTRIGRHSDTERARRMGWTKEVYRKWEPTFADAHRMLADSEVRVGRQLAKQLERGRC